MSDRHQALTLINYIVPIWHINVSWDAWKENGRSGCNKENCTTSLQVVVLFYPQKTETLNRCRIRWLLSTAFGCNFSSNVRNGKGSWL